MHLHAKARTILEVHILQRNESVWSRRQHGLIISEMRFKNYPQLVSLFGPLIFKDTALLTEWLMENITFFLKVNSWWFPKIYGFVECLGPDSSFHGIAAGNISAKINALESKNEQHGTRSRSMLADILGIAGEGCIYYHICHPFKRTNDHFYTGLVNIHAQSYTVPVYSMQPCFRTAWYVRGEGGWTDALEVISKNKILTFMFVALSVSSALCCLAGRSLIILCG